jgi:uncharacterized PurR-regulated membrane protein YhhQ (DUF165 family)
MDFNRRKDLVFIVLAGFFVTNTIVAELIGGKLVQFFGLFTQSIGIILWPVTYITVGLITYTFLLISIGLRIPAVGMSPVNDATFQTVFGQSQWIIVGSIVAFFFSQLIDVYVFWVFRNKTQGKYIWLRATGSTVISQAIDTFVVQFIAFVIPGKWTLHEFLKNASWGYGFKLLVALCLIPFIYLGHHLINKFLKYPQAHTT